MKIKTRVKFFLQNIPTNYQKKADLHSNCTKNNQVHEFSICLKILTDDLLLNEFTHFNVQSTMKYQNNSMDCIQTVRKLKYEHCQTIQLKL